MDIQHTHIAAAGVASALLPAESVTATGNGAGVQIAGNKGTAVAILNVGTPTGTTPTLAPVLQEADDNATWTNVPNGAFNSGTNITAAGVFTLSFRPGERKAYIRVSYTVGGTTPSFPVACELLALH